jgi:hypothetical protein
VSNLDKKMTLKGHGITLKIREEDGTLVDIPEPRKVSNLMETDRAKVWDGTLKLIASDISTQTKVVFPEDAILYFKVGGYRYI